MNRRLFPIEKLFWFWYLVGLVLLSTIGVPKPLQFSNGLFNIFYAAYVIKLERDQLPMTQIHWRGAVTLLLVGVWTWGIEVIGVATGWPFGEYSYTSVLGFAVLGVPISIVAAWIAIIGNAILIADRLLHVNGRKKERRLGWRSNPLFYLLYRSLVVALIAILFDLVLDPVAHARAFWVWGTAEQNHVGVLEVYGFMGIPWSNFMAWGGIAAILSWLYPVPAADAESLVARDKPFRLFQAVLLLFGVLGLIENLVVCFVIAMLAILAAEGGIRYARSQEERLV